MIEDGSLPEGLGASGLQIGGGGLRVGHDAGFPVSDLYTPPFAWTGTLRRVRFVHPQAPTAEDHATVVEALLHRE